MAGARREIGARRESECRQLAKVARSALASWWERLALTGLIHAVPAVSAGLLLGLVLGQQTWRHVTSSKVSEPGTAAVDTEAAYSLDYLSGTPRGSFTETYLSLTSAVTDQEPF